MNEILIRRLLGALVLLAVAFVVASLLPDPATDEPARASPAEQVVRYDLQTGQALGLKLEPRLQEAPPVDGKAGSTPVAEPERKTGPEPTTEVPVEVVSKPPVTQAPAPPKSASASSPAGWSVQVGSFSDPANARAVREKLAAAKLAASVQDVRVGNAQWYRVRVGPFAKEAAASKALEAVQRLGYRGARVVKDPAP